ncbi:MAG: ferrous iron transport protein A [Spirochaetaceae bacterium]|jgi:ferrous iron transport protein A|nr:ferrous iron transport protein A [Spirochaetaceae bacterium]
MPLALYQPGVEIPIKKIGGRDELRKRLEKMGFTAGSLVTVLSRLEGSLIVKIRDSRVAISEEMALKILV